MSQYFNETIYNEIMQTEMTFPTIEFSGYSSSQKLHALSNIFNTDQIEEIELTIGKSIYFTHLFTEATKSKTEK